MSYNMPIYTEKALPSHKECFLSALFYAYIKPFGNCILCILFKTVPSYPSNRTYSLIPIGLHQRCTSHFECPKIDSVLRGTPFHNVVIRSWSVRTRNTSAVMVTTPTPLLDGCVDGAVLPPPSYAFCTLSMKDPNVLLPTYGVDSASHSMIDVYELY